MEKLVGIPESNYEHFQLLRYEVGQKYGVHHDYIDSQVARAPGPRVSARVDFLAFAKNQPHSPLLLKQILTVFLYLNDVEAGGGTNFPDVANLVSLLPVWCEDCVDLFFITQNSRSLPLS